MDLGLVILDTSSGAGVVDSSTLEVSDSSPGELFSSKADSLLDDEHNIEDWSEDCCLRFSRFLSSEAGQRVSEAVMLDMFSGVGDAKLKSTLAAVTDGAVGEEVTGGLGSPPAAVCCNNVLLAFLKIHQISNISSS